MMPLVGTNGNREIFLRSIESNNKREALWEKVCAKEGNGMEE